MACSAARTKEVSVESPSLHHVITFDGPPDAVFDALVDAARFAEWTGSGAEITAAPGGALSLFGGQIEGCNVELIRGKRVVQAWRVAGWEPGTYSLVRFELRPDGTGTELTFDHFGYPPEAHQDLDAGWHAMYWAPMQQYLAVE
jgi:activator of HSP90 ATPase